MNKAWIYILTNYNRNVIYIGVTTRITDRLLQHRCGEYPGFTSKYNCRYLLYTEEYDSISNAIKREKQLKNWKREWKFNLIKETNPSLNDLILQFIDKDTLEAFDLVNRIGPETSPD